MASAREADKGTATIVGILDKAEAVSRLWTDWPTSAATTQQSTQATTIFRTAPQGFFSRSVFPLDARPAPADCERLDGAAGTC